MQNRETSREKKPLLGISKLLASKSNRSILKRYLASSTIIGAAHNEVKISTPDAIPEPPPIPEPSTSVDTAAEIVNQLNALGEPTFASLGLGGWTPVGMVQNCFEYLHVTIGIPWWEAIIIGNFQVLCHTSIIYITIIHTNE